MVHEELCEYTRMGLLFGSLTQKKCFWKSNAAAVSWEKLFNSYNSEDDDDAI